VRYFLVNMPIRRSLI